MAVQWFTLELGGVQEKMLNKVIVPIAAFCIFTFASTASASVMGTLDLSSGANTVTVTGTTITWNGDFTVSNSTTLNYDGGMTVPGGTQGVIKNLGPLPTSNFMTFPTIPALIFDLTGLGPGSSNTTCAGLTVGESCSVFSGSPFVLTATSTGTSVFLSATGTVTDGTVPISTWVGTYSEPITGLTPAQIQTMILAPNGSVTEPYAGNFILTLGTLTPEPSTAPLLAMAGCLVFALFRRKRNRA